MCCCCCVLPAMYSQNLPSNVLDVGISPVMEAQRRAAVTIQRGWRQHRFDKIEFHRRRLLRLTVLNEKAVALQRWWRKLLLRQQNSAAFRFRASTSTSRYSCDPREVAELLVWRNQESVLRRISSEEVRSFWSSGSGKQPAKKVSLRAPSHCQAKGHSRVENPRKLWNESPWLGEAPWASPKK